MVSAQLLSLPDGRVPETWGAGPRDGPALVFIHGTPSSGMPYASMRAALGRHGVRTITWS
jgi:pimeloyl-ACP methyl ester carboxylesterase